jgi:tRNA 2-thiouridine synthesizing protein A
MRRRDFIKVIGGAAVFEVHCTDPLAVIDIPNLIRETGDRIDITERNESRIVFLIEKAPRPIPK